jgi:hypothetical protein
MRVHPLVAGDEILYRDEIGNLLIYNVSSAVSRILLNSSNTVSSRISARARARARIVAAVSAAALKLKWSDRGIGSRKSRINQRRRIKRNERNDAISLRAY